MGLKRIIFFSVRGKLALISLYKCYIYHHFSQGKFRPMHFLLKYIPRQWRILETSNRDKQSSCQVSQKCWWSEKQFVLIIQNHKVSWDLRCLNHLPFGTSAASGKSIGITYETSVLKPYLFLIWGNLSFVHTPRD